MANNAMSENQSIVQQLSDLIVQADLKMPTDTDQLWQMATQAEVHAALYQVKAGLAYKALKDKLAHGQFEKGLKERGIQSRNAQRNIAVAELVCDSNTTTLSHLIEMKYSQLIELTRLPEQKIQTLEPAEVKEFAKLPVRALRGVVKQINLEFEQQDSLEAQNANLKHQLYNLQQEAAEAITELNHERLKKSPDTLFDLPPLVAQIKQRIPALSQQVAECGLDIVNLVERVSSASLDQEQAQQAAKALYHFTVGPALQLHRAMDNLVERFGSDLFGDTSVLPTYSQVEWESAEDKRKAVIDIHLARFHDSTPKKGGR